MNVDPINPQKFKGLNNSQVFAGAILFDAFLYVSILMWLFNQNFKTDKFYIFLSLVSFIFLLIIPISLYKFLFKVEEEITKRVEISNSKEVGKEYANAQIKKYLEEFKDGK